MVFYICSNSLSLFLPLSFCDYNFLFCYLEIAGELYNDIIYWVGIRVVINVHASLHLKSLPPSPSLLSLPPSPSPSLLSLSFKAANHIRRYLDLDESVLLESAADADRGIYMYAYWRSFLHILCSIFHTLYFRLSYLMFLFHSFFYSFILSFIHYIVCLFVLS